MIAKKHVIARLIAIFVLALGFLPVHTGAAQTYTCPCSIWGLSATPDTSAVTETDPVELGVQLRSDVDGYITAIRFYKGPGNTGPHYGHVWSTDGILLGEVLFTGESDTGWQEAALPTPIHILANTTYIASYHSPAGRWSYDANYFPAQITNPPLRALAFGDQAPGNGVYKYGANGSFPNLSVGSNYWVDIVFDESVGPDTTPPTVASTAPANGTTGVAIDANLTVRFSEAMAAATINTATIELRNAANVLIPAAISYSGGNYTLTLNPDADLAYSSVYTVNIKSGMDGVKDLAGNALAVDYSWTFTTIDPDTTPPLVAATIPANEATGVATNANLTARFNEAMTAATVTSANVELRNAANNLIAAAVSYTSSSYTITINPDFNLAYASAYTVRIKGGSGGAADLSGNPLAADYTWTFITADPPPPPPGEGPGGPILIIVDAGNPFGRYYAEILRNEGLNAFTVIDISLVTEIALNEYDVVLLAELSQALTAGEVTLLTDWVTDGGNLIAMRPDAQLSNLLGLTQVSGILPAAGTLNAYLKIDTSAPPGQGLVGETIQYHGNANLYNLSGATAIADLYTTASSAAGHPAVTLKAVGSNGGEAAAFAYDLARSVVYTRQGNPAWAGQNRDNTDPSVPRIISHDMFYGNASWDPQPDYIDWSKITIPQADEQMRLFAKLIQHMNRDKKPLPHFWYFPRMEKAVVIMTGDDHGNGGTLGRFDHYKTISPTGCSVDNWECIRASSYVWAFSGLTDAVAAQYTADGFEIGWHINTNCVDWTPAGLQDFYTNQLTNFRDLFPSLPWQISQRTHCVTWTDWASQPKTQLAHGIRMDTNYYYYPPAWIQERPGLFTGSGMVMRFADLDGAMIDVYQAVTQMTDESSLQGYGAFNPLQIATLLDNATGPNGYYGAFTANMHTDSVVHAGSTTIINSALAHGVPVVSGRQMVTWLDGRNASAFENIVWNDGELSFDVQAAAGANGLQALLPYQTGAGYISAVSRGGSPVTFTREVIKGVEYTIFPAVDGSYIVTYTPDTTAPVISQVTIVPDSQGNAEIEWFTDEAGSSRVEYGLTPDNLSLSAAQPALVTAHAITLTGLAPATTYYLRLSSTDLSDNTGRHPASGTPPASFTTPSAAWIDTTFADFSAGTNVANVYVSNDGNGEISLAPETASEFNGAVLPAGWFIVQYPLTGSGGTAVVNGGVVTVNGARIGTDALIGPGVALEFVATFTGAPYQHIGFGTDFQYGPWAIFSTDQNGTVFQARTNTSVGGYAPIDTTISGSWFSTPHLFRIEWRADRFVFFIDGQQVAEHMAAISANMRPMASDYQSGGAAITVDWLRMSPYQTPGTFQSRIFDAVGAATWLAPSWTATIPAGTQLSLSARTGNTPTPDETWTAFTPLAYGHPLGQSSRYIQYQAAMTTTDPRVTPALQEIAFGYTLVPDTTPPSIESRTPAQDATEVQPEAQIIVTFNEAMNPGTINAANVRVRRTGASQDVPATITYANRIVTLDPDAKLALYATYQVTVAGAVADLSGNPLGSDVTWSFTTTKVGAFTDTAQDDFIQGTRETGSYIAGTANGEIILAPVVGEEFEQTGLPDGWLNLEYGGSGTTTVNNGWLIVDGRRVGPSSTFPLGDAGRWLEFVGRFENGVFTHVGFGNTYDDPPWAIFSTGSTAATLQARSHNGATGIDNNLAIPWNNAPHRYRIEWNAGSVVFLVDGVAVDTHNNPLSAAMRPLISEYNAGGNVLAVDWMRMGPYAASGTFVSRVLDAGALAQWTDLTYTADVPTGTSLSFETRTSVNNSTWSDWQAVNSPIASPNGRYAQYRAVLATTDPNRTAELADVTISYELLEPTAVTMGGASAAVQNGQAILTWQTALEIDMIGFNVYRSETPEGPRLKLNDEIIPAGGETFGSTYQFTDDTFETGKTVYYWIEMIEISGYGEFFGPIAAFEVRNVYLPGLFLSSTTNKTGSNLNRR